MRAALVTIMTVGDSARGFFERVREHPVLILIGGAIGAVAMELFGGIPAATLWRLALLIGIDTGLGVLLAMRRKQFNSAGLSRAGGKAAFYYGVLAILNVGKNASPEPAWVVFSDFLLDWAGVVFILSEVVSIVEHGVRWATDQGVEVPPAIGVVLSVLKVRQDSLARRAEGRAKE